MINETKTEINDKYKYFTDIKALGVVEGTNTVVVVDNAGNETKITFGVKGDEVSTVEISAIVEE